MPNPRPLLLFPLLALLFALGVHGGLCLADPLLKPNDKAPSFGLKPLYPTTGASSETVFLDAYLARDAAPPAKLLLLGFFASWCAPCKAEFPALLRIEKTWRERGLGLLIVNIDREEDGQKAALDFIKAQNPPFPVLSDRLNLVVRRYFDTNITLPTAFLLDRQGTILEVFSGVDAPAAIEAFVAARLGANAAKPEAPAPTSPTPPSTPRPE